MTSPSQEFHEHKPELVPHKLLKGSQVHHPAVLQEARKRNQDFQLRVAVSPATVMGPV